MSKEQERIEKFIKSGSIDPSSLTPKLLKEDLETFYERKRHREEIRKQFRRDRAYGNFR